MRRISRLPQPHARRQATMSRQIWPSLRSCGFGSRRSRRGISWEGNAGSPPQFWSSREKNVKFSPSTDRQRRCHPHSYYYSQPSCAPSTDLRGSYWEKRKSPSDMTNIPISAENLSENAAVPASQSIRVWQSVKGANVPYFGHLHTNAPAKCHVRRGAADAAHAKRAPGALTRAARPS